MTRTKSIASIAILCMLAAAVAYWTLFVPSRAADGVYMFYRPFYEKVVLELKRGDFRYWHWNHRSREFGPFAGRFSTDGDTITLQHRDLPAPFNTWRVITHQGKQYLLMPEAWDEWAKTRTIPIGGVLHPTNKTAEQAWEAEGRGLY